MNDIHTCSYSCERPECIKAQRDELAAAFTKMVRCPSCDSVTVSYCRSCGWHLVDAREAHEAAYLNSDSSVKRATKQTAPKKLWGRKLTRSERQCWAQGFNAATVAVVSANPCRCIDCGGDELTHSSDCTNMAELHGTPAAHEMEED